MLREPGRVSAPRVWRQGPSFVPKDVRAILAAADLAAERTAARVRLGVLILIGLALVGLGALAGIYSEWIATIFAVNLGVSIAAVVLARTAAFRSWVPWIIATLDGAAVIGVIIFGASAERVPVSYTPALAVSWVMFLLIALTEASIRYDRGGARHTEEWDTLLINRVRALWIKALDEDDGDDEDDEEAGDEKEGPVKTRYVKDFTGSVAE